MNHKCKCGSDRFIRRWAGVDIHTPCTIDLDNQVVQMDFSEEEQVEGNLAFTEFYCAECETTIDGDLALDLVTEYQYE